MKYQNNPMLDEMLGEPVKKDVTSKVVQVRVTEDEKTQYEELMKMHIDMPFMIREFIRKMHEKTQ